jgi:hypothetical protein
MVEELEKSDGQSRIVNMLCLCYPGVMFLVVRLMPDGRFYSALWLIALWGYFLTVPVALVVLVCVRSVRIKAGAKRAIIGFLLTFAVFPLAFPEALLH